jgi:hypothetical protein
VTSIWKQIHTIFLDSFLHYSKYHMIDTFQNAVLLFGRIQKKKILRQILSVLPTELKDMVLLHLASKDIGNLRLASRTFRQLPGCLFLSLTQDELPWFRQFDELKVIFAEYCERLSNKQPRCKARCLVLTPREK